MTADSKEQVLKSLAQAATKLRRKLGESLSSVQRFDTPIEQATTPSLEALQAYSLGMKLLIGKSDFDAALPLFQRAIDLDRNFAAAYSGLVLTYRFYRYHGVTACLTSFDTGFNNTAVKSDPTIPA